MKIAIFGPGDILIDNPSGEIAHVKAILPDADAYAGQTVQVWLAESDTIVWREPTDLDWS